MSSGTDKEYWVFLRGLVRGSGHWYDFIEGFKKHRPQAEIETLDIPGNGTHNEDKTPIDLTALVNQIREQSQFIKQNKEVYFLGMSLGAMVGVTWSEMYPKEIKKLILINSSFRDISAFFNRLNPWHYLDIVKGVLSSDAQIREEIILSMTSNNEERRNQFIHKNIDFYKEHPVKRENFIRQIILGIKMRSPEELHVPSLVLCSKKDRLVNYRCSTKLAHNLKSDLKIHTEAGHDLILDDPDWVIKRVNNFIDQQ